ncbi:hypothetical protein [Streptomyces sp. NPDC047108]|uniref:hypothetical protein n=1 Tax=Streptomyces sp. NPDC047108 TaxID=3155025 RepID=UPI0033F4A28A
MVEVTRRTDTAAAVQGGGAHTSGGNGNGTVQQTNTAQEGRQSNVCGNQNEQATTLSGSRVRTRCAATDESTNIGSRYEG